MIPLLYTIPVIEQLKMLDIDIYKTILLMNILHKAFLSKSFKGRFPIQPGKLIVMRLVILSGCGIWKLL